MLFADLSYRIPDAIYEGHAHAVMLAAWVVMWIVGFATSMVASDEWMTPNRFCASIVAHMAVGVGLLLLLDSWPNWIIYLTTVGFAFAVGKSKEISQDVIVAAMNKLADSIKKK